MYGSHPYSTPPGQPQQGPPQPEWRLGASTQPQSSWHSIAVSPPPPSSSPLASARPYNHGVYGQMSSPPPPPSVSPLSGFTQNADTTAWGVRYNNQSQPIQHAQSPPPPPLPPRPSSTTAPSLPHGQPHWQAPAPPAPSYGPPPPTTAGQHQQWTLNAPYSPQHVGSLPPPPPPPPPIPPPVTQPLQQVPPPPPYSDTVIGTPVSPLNTDAQQSHVFHQHTGSLAPQPPLPGHPATTVSNGVNLGPSTAAPPVPPKMSPLIVPTGASALGSGGPSDWEHLSPVPGNVDDFATFEPRRDTAHTRTYSELPTNQSVGTSDIAPTSQSAVSTPPNVSPPSHHANMRDGGVLPNQMKQSPVSPSTSLELPNPPRPMRVDTAESTYSTASGTGASASIDKVIEAWKYPAPSEGNHTAEQGADMRTESPASLHEPSPLDISKLKQGGSQSQNELSPSQEPPHPNSATNEPGKKVETPLNPPALHDDLDPWSKSSLERYIAMLRKEAVADSDEERFKLFTAFMAKEMKLREILYNIEHDAKADEPTSARSASSQQNPNQSMKAEPGRPTSPIDSGLIPVETEFGIYDSTVPEETEDGRYSPGGRPILPRLYTPVSAVGLHRSASLAVGGGRDRMGLGQFSRPTSVPPVMNEAMRKQELSPLTTNPPNAIYTPFRYAEGPQRGSDNLMFDRPAYQAYSALRQASAESGRIMSNTPVPSTTELSSSVTPSVQNENDETFIGLIREKSVAYRNKPPRRISSPPPPLPAALRQGNLVGPIDELRAMISSPLAKKSESSWHITAKVDIEKYSNDFAYIREAMKTWEMENRPRREKLDKERMQRQEESEAHIDELFNEKEIGYADINVLEEDFRQTEARVQLDEERREVEDFADKVFTPLNDRLTEDISALHGHYESALGQLSHENSSFKDSVQDKYNLSHSMKAVSEICRKLELRYQKRLEIALDLERRRKKAERRPLVFMGDSAALKKVDADFDQMEKQNILRAARDRDERANRLMDSFDEAIIHGLGENQRLLDEVTTKVLKIDVGAVRSSGLAEPEVEQMFKSVHHLIDSLRQDSETILHHFGLADAALNDADYQVSVAEARCSGAEIDVLQRLDQEKKKEDAKIQTDLQSKIASVRAGPGKLIATMNDVLKALGRAPVLEEPELLDPSPDNHPVDALLPGVRPSTAKIPSKPSGEDAEHQERLRKALDDAKKRNAARNTPAPQS